MPRVGFLERGKDAVLEFLETRPHVKRETPKINGSFGGFIALVVCLAMVIIVSCTAVYFLVRDQKAYDQEQARRHPYHRASGRHSSSYFNNDTAPKPWYTGLRTLFSHRNTSDNTQTGPDSTRVKIRGTGQHGWVQAGLEDDWEPDSTEERRRQLGVREVLAQNPPSVISVPSIIRPMAISRSNSDSTSSVRFDLGQVRGLGNHDRHPSPHPTLPNIHSQLSSPSSSPAPSPMRVRSPEPVSRVATPSSSRQFSSPPSVRTFPGGTKFIEGL